MNQLTDIAAFCRQRIADWESKVQTALGCMGRHEQIPYEISHEIESAAQEWAERNGYAVDFFEGIDVKEIIMEG